MKTKQIHHSRKARVIEVVHTVTLEGDGTGEQAYREVDRYWSTDGKLLAENDPYMEVAIPACNKLRHETLKDAEDYVPVIRDRNFGTKKEKDNHRLHAYECQECGFFHVGHRRERPQ